MTGNHTMVTTRNNPVYKMIENLPFDTPSIHNIRLKFEVPNLWLALSSTELSKNKKSKDISVPIHIQDSVDIKLSVHKTNTVTLNIGCSLNPIKLDYAGHIRFYTLLARIEEQLRAKVNLNSYSPSITIPDNRYWVINMWHFGRDSLHE